MRKILSLFAAALFAGSMMASTPLNTDFTQSQGSWTINDVDLGGITYVWKQDSKYGMKASAYVSKAAHAAESWLISPAFSLSEASTATLKINHAVNNGAPTNFKVKASVDGETWNDLALSSWPAGSSWTFEDATADLSALAGEEAVKIAFVYISTTDLCPTWEVKTVKVEDDAEGGSGGEGDEVTLDVAYFDAWYLPTYEAWEFNLYKDYNEETEEVTYPDVFIDVYAKSATGIAGEYTADEIVWVGFAKAEGDTIEATSVTKLEVVALEGGEYSLALTFVGDDGKSYVLNYSGAVYAANGETGEEITLDESGDDPVVPGDLATEGIHTLTPETESEASTEGDYKVVIDGIQLEWHGAYVKNDFRVFAGKDLTITAGANIAKVEIAGKANKANFELTVNHGTITTGASYAEITEKADIEDPLIVVDKIGSPSVKLTCGKQLRAYTIRVTLEGAEGIEEILLEGKTVKVIREGNILIMKGDKVYNAMGQIVK